jgi:hypothetical protein
MPDHSSPPLATDTARNRRAGRWLVRAGYTVCLGALAALVVESILSWGETSDMGCGLSSMKGRLVSRGGLPVLSLACVGAVVIIGVAR